MFEANFRVKKEKNVCKNKTLIILTVQTSELDLKNRKESLFFFKKVLKVFDQPFYFCVMTNFGEAENGFKVMFLIHKGF